MSHVYPFKAVYPKPEVAAKVAAPPYDVVSSEEAAAAAAGNPLSFFHVSRPEIDLPPGTDLHSAEVYEKARENYAAIRRDAPLLQEDSPCFYVYSLVMNGRRQTGVVVAAAVEEYDQGLIKKHEKTRKDKEDDRTRHILTLRSQTGPVFLTCRPLPGLAKLVKGVMDNMPILDLTANDGVRHTIWRVSATAEASAIATEFRKAPALYIADGHHRAASASRTCAELRQANPMHTGLEEYNRFLSVIFPSDQLAILPYNRLVLDLNGLSQEQFITKCRAAGFSVSPADSATPTKPGSVHAYLGGGQWLKLTSTADRSQLQPTDRLDVSLLQDLVLAPILGIADPRTSTRIEFVGGIRGTKPLEEKVNQGKAAVAFSMYPTTVDQLMEIADAGGIMPPKSTWFEPKLRDALLIHDI